MKKVVLIASGTAEKETIKWKNKLEVDGFEILAYPLKIEKDNFIVKYEKSFNLCYTSIPIADMVLVVNIEKNGIAGYIGPGTFAEIAFAIGIRKAYKKDIDICYINPLPKNLPCSIELGLWKELGWIKQINNKIGGELNNKDNV